MTLSKPSNRWLVLLSAVGGASALGVVWYLHRRQQQLSRGKEKEKRLRSVIGLQLCHGQPNSRCRIYKHSAILTFRGTVNFLGIIFGVLFRFQTNVWQYWDDFFHSILTIYNKDQINDIIIIILRN